MTQQVSYELAPHYKPRTWAVAAHRSKAKRKVLWVHRRGGKGWFGSHEGLGAYVTRLGTRTEGLLIPAFHAWTVSPTFPQARQIENELEEFIPAWARPPITRFDDSRGHSKADNIFRLIAPGGYGQWEVKSAHDPETLQTVGLDYLHVQECQDIPEEAFNKLLPTLRSPERLSLSVWEGIPPDDPNHWFARLIADAEDDDTGHSIAIRVPYTDNTDLTPETIREIERDQEVMVDRDWRRMYLVELPAGFGSFLGDVDGAIGGRLIEEPEDGHRYVMGIDVAKKVDFTVLTVMDSCCRKLVWHRRFGGMDWVVQEEAIIEASKKLNTRRIIMDTTGVGDPLYDRLLWKGLPIEPFIFTNESKYRLLTDLAVGIEKRYLSYPEVPIMTREMKSLRATKTSSGRISVSAPRGSHDDYPMSLALCYSLCDPPPDMAIVGRLASKRYVPLQNEMGGSGFLADIMKQRRTERLKKRLEEAGVT